MARFIYPDHTDLPARADVVVIGGGIVGAATAFYSSRAGLETVVVERGEALGALATAASAGTFRALFDDRDVVALTKASIEVFKNMAEVIRLPGYDIGFRPQGYLFASREPDGLQILGQAVAHKRRIGLDDVELLDGLEARYRFPYLGAQVTAAIYRAEDGWLSPHEATYGFALGSSARFLLGTRAIRILVDGQGVCGVETAQGAISSRTVVLAAGAFAPELAATVDLDLPLDVVRLQQVVVHPQWPIPQSAPVTVDWTTNGYWRPEVGGALLGWSDLTPNEEPSEQVLPDWQFPALALEQASHTTPFWKEVAKQLRGPQVHASAGQVSFPCDVKPILGPAPGIEGLFLNVGHAYGVMAAPAAGRQVVDLITGRMAEKDNAFGYQRLTIQAAPRGDREQSPSDRQQVPNQSSPASSGSEGPAGETQNPF